MEEEEGLENDSFPPGDKSPLHYDEEMLDLLISSRL